MVKKRRKEEQTTSNAVDAAGGSVAIARGRRPLWLVIVMVAAIAAAFSLSAAFLGGVSKELALPVRIEVVGLGSAADGGLLEHIEFSLPRSQFEKIQGVKVQIGNRTFAYTKEQFQKSWKVIERKIPGNPEAILTATSPEELSVERSSLPWYQSWINWPGDAVMLYAMLPSRLLIVTVLFAALAACLRMGVLGRLERLALAALAWETPNGASTSRPCGPNWAWLLGGGAVLVAAIVVLEVNQPFYFCQDDQFASGLPTIVQSMRGGFRGEFPEWNAYELMGAPLAALGYSGVLYPPYWISYAIARYGFGNELLTNDVFAIFHLVVGYFAMYWATRKAGCRASLAAAASLAFVLSGYMLIVGRGWATIMSHLIWAPLMIVALLNLEQRKAGWKWAIGTSACLAIFYYNGFSQWWLYPTLGFGVAGVLSMTLGMRASPWRSWAGCLYFRCCYAFSPPQFFH